MSGVNEDEILLSNIYSKSDNDGSTATNEKEAT
jgi:hypothetical protein